MKNKPIRNKGSWPKAVLYRSIKPEARVCCKCSNPIHGRGSFYIFSPEPGKYLCPSCDKQRNLTNEVTVK